MNLFELTKLDLKDIGKIDYQKLLKDLRKKPDVLFATALVIGTLIFCFQFYGQHQHELTRSQSEISMLQQKLKLLDTYNATKKELDEFVTKSPKAISEEGLINRVTDWAEKHNIQIFSFSPAHRQTDRMSEIISVVITVSSSNYKDMWLFVREIEKSNFSIRIDRWTGSMQDSNQGRGGKGPQSSEAVNAQIEISAVNFKNG